MIVRNENKIIERLLKSVIPIIEFYCICDTETEDKKELTYPTIQSYLETYKIKGTIHQFEFKNFEYARNKALEYAVNDFPEAKYYLLLDADMILELNDISKFKLMLDNDDNNNNGWCFFQGSDKLHYKNVRLIKKSAVLNGIKYIGWTHEYISNYNFKCFPKNIIFINDIEDGGYKTNKYGRDIELLKSYINSDQYVNVSRQYYYLGYSNYCLHNYDDAIKYFQLAIDNEAYEKWNCMYLIGHCYVHKNDNINAIKSYNCCTSINPHRIENLYHIFNITHDIKVYEKALPLIFNYIEEFYNDFLLVELDIYEYLFVEKALRYIKSFSTEFIIFNLFRTLEKYENIRFIINNHCTFHKLRQSKIINKYKKFESITVKYFIFDDKTVCLFIKNKSGMNIYSKIYLTKENINNPLNYKIKFNEKA